MKRVALGDRALGKGEIISLFSIGCIMVSTPSEMQQDAPLDRASYGSHVQKVPVFFAFTKRERQRA